MAEAAALSPPVITVTDSAAARVRVLIENEGNPNLMLRLAVLGGGCSGFQYSIDLDDSVNEDDQVFQQHGISAVIDQTSLEMLNGTVIDYVEDLMGASFQIRNPNATSTCGCGSSFSV